MRLWHYKIIPFLPTSQLLAQWRELNSIFKKQDKHILINYVYEYPKDDLYNYSNMVIREMLLRGINFKWNNFDKFFGNFGDDFYIFEKIDSPFHLHHNRRYLKQCFYNLQEKYDRGQKDFTEKQYTRLLEFMRALELPRDIQ